jgi:heat shock protein HtpX
MSMLYNNVKTVLFLGGLTALMLWFGSFFGQAGLIFAFILAAVMNIVGFFFSDKIAIMSVRGQQVGPEHPLHRITAELAQRAGLPMPRVYVSPIPAPNAFATGRSPNHAAVCATQGLLDMLTPNEIAGVMAHELAHVKHRDILIQSVAVTIGGAISMLAQSMMFFGVSRHGDDEDAPNPLVMLALALLAPIAAMLIQMAISRSREYNADKYGAELTGDPMDLATALEKIHVMASRVPVNVNPAMNSMFIAEPRNLMRSVGALFQTHPPLEKRLMNLIGRPSTGMAYA